MIVGFWLALESSPQLNQVLIDYAHTVVNLIEELKPKTLDDLGIGIEHDQVVSSMQVQNAVILSKPGFELLGRGHINALGRFLNFSATGGVNRHPTIRARSRPF
jgi:hypothetical protein